MKVTATSFKRSHAHTAALSAPDPAAGHCQPLPLLETPGHSQASLGQFLLRSLLLSPGSWCAQDFVCALQESVSPVLWKFCSQIPLAFKVKFPRGLSPFARTFAAVQKPLGITVLQFMGGLLSSSMVGLMVTSCKKTFAIYCASQLCSSQRPCLHGRPLLIQTSAGGTQALKGRSGLVSCGVPGSWCTQDLV